MSGESEGRAHSSIHIDASTLSVRWRLIYRLACLQAKRSTGQSSPRCIAEMLRRVASLNCLAELPRRALFEPRDCLQYPFISTSPFLLWPRLHPVLVKSLAGALWAESSGQRGRSKPSKSRRTQAHKSCDFSCNTSSRHKSSPFVIRRNSSVTIGAAT